MTGATGVAIIWWRQIPVLTPAYRWLLVAIVLYVVTFAISVLVQRPAMRRAIELTSGSGEPGPQLPATLARVGRNGMLLSALTVALVFLMVVKPTLGA